MFCPKCGNQIADGELFCGYCGTAVERQDAFEPYGQSTYETPEQPQEEQPVQPQVQQPVAPPVAPVQPQYQQQNYQQQAYQQQTYRPPVQPQFQAYQQPFNNNFQIQQEISSARTLGILSIILGIFIPLAGWICGGIGLSKAKRHLFSNDIMIRTSAQKAKKLNKIGLILTSVLFALVIIVYIVVLIVLPLVLAGSDLYYYF